MKKYIISLLFGAVLIAPFWAYAQINLSDETIAALQAQIKALTEQIQALQASQPSVGGGAGGGGGGSVGIPRSLPVPPTPPGFDDDFDEIVQFNNLIIRGIFGPSFPAEIKASYEVGVRCQKFQSESASGLEYPCPLSPSVLYTIKVDSDTRLLLRNRLRANLRDFEIGDRINVYGFTDENVSAIDAVVVRNLDKPQRQSFIQLNNMEVLSAPSSARPPATFTVVNTFSLPCRDYSENQNIGVPIPCPLGLEMQEQVSPASGASSGWGGAGGAIAPNFLRKYLITVTAQTSILDSVKKPMRLSGISVGDKLNIYGSYGNDSSRIQAITIRDLSKPVSDQGSFRVSVVDYSGCVRPLSTSAVNPSVQPEIGEDMVEWVCGGTIYNAAVYLNDANGTLVAKSGTEHGFAFFENLAYGRYQVTAIAPGYSKNSVGVGVSSNQPVYTTIQLYPEIVQPPPQRGTLYIAPPSLSIEINKAEKMQAFYQSPMPPCTTPNVACILEMPAPYPVEAKWVIANETIAGFSYQSSAVILVNGLSVGATEIQAIYTDPSGNILTAVAPIKVYSSTSSNRPPVISGIKGPATLKVGEIGTWSVSAQDPENGPLSYSVIWGDEGRATYSLPLSASPVQQTTTFTHSYAREGNYTPVFYVTDNQGLSAKTSISVNVVATTQPSITVLSPNGGEVWTKGTTQTIKWQPYKYISTCVTGNNMPCPVPTQAPVTITLKSPPIVCITTPCPLMPETSIVLASNIYDSGQWAWVVGKNVNGVQIPDGKYIISIPNGISADSSDAPFSIVAATQASYPGFFMKLDKSSYAPTDTLVLTSSRADGKTAYYPVDIYAVRNRDNVRTLIQASASIALNTNTYIFLDRWAIFKEGGAGDYLILFCDASKECIGGVNTNSIGFSILWASSGGGGGGSGTGSTTGALAPTSSQMASILEALRIMTEDLNNLLNQLR